MSVGEKAASTLEAVFVAEDLMHWSVSERADCTSFGGRREHRNIKYKCKPREVLMPLDVCIFDVLMKVNKDRESRRGSREITRLDV